VFFVSRWDLVDRVLRDPALLAGRGVTESFGLREGLLYDITTCWLMSLDGPSHVRARGLVRREFTARRVEGLRGFIEKTAGELVAPLLDEMRAGPSDLIRPLAFGLPSEVIRHLFRIERDAWREEIEPLFLDKGGDVEAGREMLQRLAEFFQERVRAAGEPEPEGLLAKLRVADEEHGELSELEVVANAVLLVTAAIDTTAGLIGNAVLCLLDDPEAQRRVRADPDLVPAAVDETLRFEPPALSCSRFAPEPLELAGVEIPAGSHLLLGLGAANRDPARYPDPDRFDLDRDHTGLLSFGGGRHFCLGAALARLEAQAIVSQLFGADAPALERAGEAPWRTDNPTVRALQRLPVRAAAR
jgi:cytochrome P450